MTATAALTGQTLDSIIDQLSRFQQRATYGAVAGVVDSSPRSLMKGRPRDQRSCWVVGRSTGQPTGYADDQVDPRLNSRETVLGTTEDLRAWLENPS